MTAALKKDLPAGLVVFLVALPLCLGVALASGAPLMSGVISGIIGGIVVGFISKSQTSVSGPAAGLTAIVLSSITQLGSFELFLSALVIAGFLQLAMGFGKIGFIANYVPSNVIKGLLAAIGIILILKQTPHALGYDADPEGDYSFFQPNGENTISELVNMLNYIHPGVTIIGVLSVSTLILWDKIPVKAFRFVPGSLFVVVMGVLLNLLFVSTFPALIIEQSHLVTLPEFDSSSFFHLPALADFKNYQVFTVAVTIALVASLETLLNIEAVDKLDPHKRESPPNRELVAQGIGNVFAGFLGGLPVTSVIVRSSVNIGAGNETKLSTISHGMLMLVSIIALSPILNLIPLSSLAAILLVTGYKLAKVSIFKEMFAKGWNQFIPFIVTIVAIVFTDLLIGIVIGLGVSVFYLLKNNFRNPFTLHTETLSVGEVIKVDLSEEVSFLNKASIRETLWQIPNHSKVIIDASKSSFIDEDVLELIRDFKTTVAPERDIQLNVLGLREKYKMSGHVQFITVLSREAQQALTPPAIIDLLKAGNLRFTEGYVSEKFYERQVNATSLGQNPIAIIVSCIDSRTSPEIVFDAGIGDLLIVRVAGNVSGKAVIGSIELAVRKIGVKLVVVMGHSNCGAIKAAIGQITDGHIGFITEKINAAVVHAGLNPLAVDTSDNALMEKVTCLNAENSIRDILSESAYLKQRVGQKEIGIVSAYYDTTSGKVSFNSLQ
ncbi:carbonic anhydrase [Pseudochryseolinea flava]|uniref:Carbonic anhydrase n=1 Tax=Pseudochryseolinea flava TaxID=2059302 RepID=A0A364Y989_9BACT|nr:carbonic anhydrase [Pseudochryseolinea flava]